MRTGLYRWFDEDGMLLYVGISINVIKRAYEHECSKAEWFGKISSCRIVYFDTLQEAQDAEREAIRTEAPRFNVLHQATSTAKPPRSAGLDEQPRKSNFLAATKKAMAFVKKNPTKLNAEQVAKKFGLHPSTVYRAHWWKNRVKPEAEQAK